MMSSRQEEVLMAARSAFQLLSSTCARGEGWVSSRAFSLHSVRTPRSLPAHLEHEVVLEVADDVQHLLAQQGDAAEGPGDAGALPPAAAPAGLGERVIHGHGAAPRVVERPLDALQAPQQVEDPAVAARGRGGGGVREGRGGGVRDDSALQPLSLALPLSFARSRAALVRLSFALAPPLFPHGRTGSTPWRARRR
jgi:hypothetical protein